MSFLLDMAPLVVFFLSYKIAGINAAVISLMIAMPACVGLMFLTKRKPSRVNYYTVALALFFGTLTLVFDDPLFIKVKATILYVSMALALSVALYFKRNPIRAMLGPALGDVPYRTYAMLAWQWVAFLLVIGLANLAVAHYMSESSWVNFKTFVAPLLIFVTFIAQASLTGMKYGFAKRSPEKPQEHL